MNSAITLNTIVSYIMIAASKKPTCSLRTQAHHHHPPLTTRTGGWGVYKQKIGSSANDGDLLGSCTIASGNVSITALYGSLTLNTLGVRTNATVATAQLSGKSVACKLDSSTGIITFTAGPVMVPTNGMLAISLSGGVCCLVCSAILLSIALSLDIRAYTHTRMASVHKHMLCIIIVEIQINMQGQRCF